MLKKLIKHELRPTRRFFLPAYAIFAALLVVERLSLLTIPAWEESTDLLGIMAGFTMILITILTIAGLIALMAAPLIYSAIRFYRNMLGDEGYLTFTLPVSTSQLIVSKLITAVIWEIITGIVVFLFGGAFLATMNAEAVMEVLDFFGRILNQAWISVGIWEIVLVVLLLATIVIQMSNQMLTFYTSMSIGQCAGKYRLLASAGCYVGIKFVTSWLLKLPVYILIFAFEGLWADQLNQTISAAMEIGNFVPFCQFMAVCLALSLLGNVLLATAHFFISRYFLTKKLNLA